MKRKLFLFYFVLCATVACIPDAALLAEELTEKQVKVLSLSDALSMSLAGNPELEGYSWDVRAKEAQALQAGLLPNPQFNPQMEDFAGSSSSFDGLARSQTTLMLNQLIELGGKRDARQEIAARQKDWSKLNYQAKRRQVLQDTLNKFHHVSADQKRLELARDSLKLAKLTLQNIKERVRAGRSSGVEGNKAEVALAQAEVEMEHREHELVSSKLRLASSWGADEIRFQSVKSELFQQESILGYKDLLENFDKGPVAKSLTIESELRDAELEFAKAGRIPDVTLGLGYRRHHDTDDNSLVAQFSVPIPLFDRNQHKVSEAVAMREQSKSLKRAATLNAQERLFSLYQELKHAELEMKVSKNSIVPKAKQALADAKNGFKKGSFSYLELTDAQEIYYLAEQNYITAALDYHEHIGEIEAILGSSITKSGKTDIK